MPGIIGLTQVAQHVTDLDRATAFYRDTLGLELMARFEPPGLAFFRMGETRLLLESSASSALLYLGVENIHEEVTRLAGEGVEFVSEPHLIHTDLEGDFGAPGVEEWMAFFRDSEGNLVSLVERRQGTEA